MMMKQRDEFWGFSRGSVSRGGRGEAAMFLFPAKPRSLKGAKNIRCFVASIAGNFVSRGEVFRAEDAERRRCFYFTPSREV
jgi:hypothetical protein